MRCRGSGRTIMLKPSASFRFLIMTAALLGAAGIALAQDATPTRTAPPNRGSVKLEKVPSLILMNPLGASLQGPLLPLRPFAPALPYPSLLGRFERGDISRPGTCWRSG